MALQDCPEREVMDTVMTIEDGADIQFVGDRAKEMKTANLKSADFFPAAIEAYLNEEVPAGRIEGPIDVKPEGC